MLLQSGHLMVMMVLQCVAIERCFIGFFCSWCRFLAHVPVVCIFLPALMKGMFLPLFMIFETFWIPFGRAVPGEICGNPRKVKPS